MLNKNKSLLEIITSKEVEDLILEQKLVEEGYSIHYFLDQVDIDKYAFPFGIVPNEKFDGREESSVEVITDEQISYDYLFNIRNEKLLLFDEHKEELQNLNRKIERVKNLGIEIVDSFKIQSEYFEDLVQGKSITFDAWSRNQELSSKLNVSLLISIALGSIRSSIENLNKLTNDRLVHSNEDYKNLNFKTNLSFIEKCKPAINTDKLFEGLIESYTETPQRLIARYKKCKVFDRILCINNISKQKKEIFLLLSSAKSINSRLPKLASKIGVGIEIENSEFNPIRSIQQIYLQLLLKDNDNKAKELEKIREILILKEKESDSNRSSLYNDLIIKYFEEELIYLREGYENVSLLLKIKDYEKLFNEALMQSKVGNLKVLAESIREILKISEESEELEKLKRTSLIELELTRDYNNILKQAVNNITFGKGSLNAFAGKDFVENAYHTIPFVIINKGSKDFQIILDKIILLATENSSDNYRSKKLLSSINDTFSLIYHKTLPDEEERIIMLLILVMIGKDYNSDPDELVLEWINEMNRTGSISKEWELDFNYIKSWILRRLGRFDEAIDVALTSKLISPNDPRFYHSLYLCYYNLYRQNSSISDITKAVEFCEIAYKFYQQQSLNYLSINKSIIAILNSLAYLNTLLYIEKQDVSILDKARNYLHELKLKDEKYYQFSEFLHTESLLELQEYKQSKQIDKLTYAKRAIESALKMRPEKSEYLKVKDEINQLLTMYMR